MKVTLKISDVDYAELAVQSLPLIRDKIQLSDGTAAKILLKLTRLPPHLIRSTLDALPQATKDDIAILLLKLNKEKVAGGLQDIVRAHGITLTIDDITFSK